MNKALSSFLATVDSELKDPKTFAKTYVNLRLQFFRQFNPGFICSTSHGIDYFDNLKACLAGKEWNEKGEYGDNFRKLIKHLKQLK